MRDPAVLPSVATMTTIQKLHGWPVRGSILVGSETRNPANGRISSEGSGIIADSIVIAMKTPTYPRAPYRDVRNGMTIWSMKASTAPRVGGGVGGRDAPGRRAVRRGRGQDTDYPAGVSERPPFDPRAAGAHAAGAHHLPHDPGAHGRADPAALRGEAPFPVALTGADLTIDDVEAVARGGAEAALDVHARERMQEARDVVERLAGAGEIVYG